MTKKIAVIGSGFSGLSAASYAAKAGHEVHVFEKNNSLGGRARQFTTDNGYVFDMGPSWYWMPDIIEDFFNDFWKTSSDYYELVSLNPQFEMVFSDGIMAVPENYSEMRDLFENIEKGAAKKLDEFMEDAQYKYEVGMKDFVTKPCHSWFEFVSPTIAKSALKLDLLSNFHRFVRKYFSHPKLIMLMEFPVIFLGAAPKDIPALYSLMNYGGYKLGTWYPMGGFYKVIEAMSEIAKDQGVQIHLNSNVDEIKIKDAQAKSIIVNGNEIEFDTIIASSDYHHTEENLIQKEYKNYSENYWKKKTFAPSCLIYYLGFKEKISNLKHHTLFFENDLDLHTSEIYEDKKWPTKPLFYACCPSKTDKNVAPENCENVFLLMPIATGIEDNEETREKYFLEMIQRLEKHTKSSDLLSKIDYKKSYCINDFKKDYNAYEGNAYGLANTLNQTAVLKPSLRNKKVNNLFYTGQLTVPGPGVPPSIISGKIAANEATK
ncbi:phytoene desaturase family protein [Chryseobacterium sp. Ch-15]|uniref:Phytoene desaturase n=1 Tax=Chryseobacterium muglaense TaxID=2893752 RepID=A0A9Q3URL2_9FLAO|nr:phytoene desaturase family protein [Chryseobacterium muglaense]MBD3904111.1 phytoene desaturase [Chryseobacterium muglaense]MCC9033317.1 phytoene desaturase [Chryseobacterium muglaense]MCM2553812.1 phytoene desaturase family protein [Chryseobacterium muglaense]